MISSKSLKDFVKMHEYKLNAKVSELRAAKLDSELEEVHWGADCLDEHHHNPTTERITRRRPKSRYFNFILTAAH